MGRQSDMELIENTVNVTIRKMSETAALDRMKALRNETFKNTEKLLYNYKALKDHVENETEYFGMLSKRTAGSIIRYSKSKAITNEDEMIRLREESLMRSKADLERLENGLKRIGDRKEYIVIEKRYFNKKRNGDTITFEEIAEELSLTGEFPETLSEKTVRRWKNSLVQELSVYIFGSDAI